MTIVFSILGLLVIALLAPVWAELGRYLYAHFSPTVAPGAVAQLPNGATHYRWSGPEDGPVAVCIHGISTPSFVFAATEQSLAAQGFRVLTYDLYGRGQSARPGGAQTSAFFVDPLEQIRQL